MFILLLPEWVIVFKTKILIISLIFVQNNDLFSLKTNPGIVLTIFYRLHGLTIVKSLIMV